MNVFIRTSVLTLLLANSLLLTAWAAAPDPSNYGYEQKIEVPNGSIGELAKIILPPQLVQSIKPDLSNVQIVNQANEPVPFRAFTGKSGKYLGDLVRIKEVSSKKEGNPLFLSDNDPLTVYSFDKKVDGRNPAWVLFDFSRPVPLNRISLHTPTDRQTIRTFSVDAGLTLDSLKPVKSRDVLSQNTDFFTPVTAQYLRINFWGPQISIWDINFFVSPEVELSFIPQEGEQYRLLYGNPDLKSIRYTDRSNSPFSADWIGSLGKRTLNPLLIEDVDQDGIDNELDNCVFNENKKQLDQDLDGIGDDCDNAPENKNYNQIDTDRDGLGDLVDNCKLRQNIDQKDKDKDGYGDECDMADGTKFELTNKTKPYFLYGILAVLIFGILGLFLSQTFSKKK